MGSKVSLVILSDIHYAGPLEQTRGSDYEFHTIANPLLRNFVRLYRHYVWMREPLCQSHRLDQFLLEAGSPDYVIANGDFTCDSAFVGLADDAAFQSAAECVEKLRSRFGNKLLTVIGDHELGKVGLGGTGGGLRISSWKRATQELGLGQCWTLELGRYVLVGLVSSLVALPLLGKETLREELSEWERLREEHLAAVRRVFEGLSPEKRVLLFLHDPTALPFLWREDWVRARRHQIEQTIIGHLHSNLVFRVARLLSGMPRVERAGHTVRRLSSALRQARDWQPFKVRLCPALAGIELLQDGGYCVAELTREADQPVHFELRRLHPRPMRASE
jgi:hypothetical protein